MPSVRIFGYQGIVQIQQTLTKQFTGHGVFMRQEPYLWQQTIELNGSTPVESTPEDPDGATMVVIEVDNDVTVRYEVNPNGPLASNHRNASTDSPRMVGDNIFQWFKGATVSFIQA